MVWQRSWVRIVDRRLRPGSMCVSNSILIERTSLPQCKVSLHNFHPPSVVDDDEDNSNKGNDKDGDNDRSSGGGGGVGGRGGERSQLDHTVDQLQPTVDPRRADAAEGEVAGVEVVGTLAGGADGVGETSVVDETKRAEQLASQPEPVPGFMDAFSLHKKTKTFAGIKFKPVSFAEASSVRVTAQLGAFLITPATQFLKSDLGRALNRIRDKTFFTCTSPCSLLPTDQVDRAGIPL